jgi:hypothetical protein
MHANLSSFAETPIPGVPDTLRLRRTWWRIEFFHVGYGPLCGVRCSGIRTTSDSAISDQAKTLGNLRVIVTDTLTEPHSWLRRKITASAESWKSAESGTRSWGLFGCRTVRLNLNWKSGRKNAFLPNLLRVCGFVIARTCAIWSLHIEMVSEPGASSSISEAVYGKVAIF